MSRILVRFSRNLIVLSTCAFVASIPVHTSTQAEQSIGALSPYSAVDPFDPSEVVAHSLKDDIRLRLRLPAPDLPPSIVASAPAKTAPSATKIRTEERPQAKSAPNPVPREPGFIGKSFQSVMSIFDWSDDSNDEMDKANPLNASLDSDEPIRINIHVGIAKSKNETPDAAATEEVSSLETPWARNQQRVRRLFTFDEIKIHN